MMVKAWLHDTVIKAINTAAQTAIALLGVDQTKWLDADVKTIALASGVAAVVTVLHHLAELGATPSTVVVTTVAAKQADDIDRI